jgi:hypothetical protein
MDGLFSNLTFFGSKYALYLFFYFKQRALKMHINEKTSNFEQVMLVLFHLVPIYGLALGIWTYPFMHQTVEQGCLEDLHDRSLFALAASAVLLDIIISFGLLKSFLDVVRDFARNSQKLTKVSSEGGIADASDKRALEIRWVMKLNRRSCVITVLGLLLTTAASLFVGASSRAENSIPASIDLALDCTSMILCSPQIWRSVKHLIDSKFDIDAAEAASSRQTHKRPSEGGFGVSSEQNQSDVAAASPPSPSVRQQNGEPMVVSGSV